MKKILLPIEIVDLKNVHENIQNIDVRNFHFKNDNAINRSVFKNNEESYIKFRMKKPEDRFNDVCVVVDCCCDLLDERIEVVIHYGDCEIMRKIIEIKKTIISRYKFNFKMIQKNFRSDFFYVTIKFLPSKRENVHNAVFTLFSVFLEVENKDLCGGECNSKI